MRKRRAKRRHLVAVVAFDGVVLGDLSTPCEIFGLVRGRDGRPLYDVRICSVTREVKSEHVILRVPWRLSSLTRADTVIVPGIARLDQRLPKALLRAIRRAVDRRARVASICSGAFVLAATGRLMACVQQPTGAPLRSWGVVTERSMSILTCSMSITELY